MKRFLWISFLLCFSFQQENKNIILWNADRPLTWDDFKGRPEKRFAAAHTAYDILKDVKGSDPGEAIIIIRAVFFCKDSWKNDYWAEKTILNHEQRHFDIVEIYARKLRKLIQQQSYSSFKDVENKCDSLYDIIDKQMDIYQDKYDDESDGSMDGAMQKTWNKKVETELGNLEAWQSISFSVMYGKTKVKK